MGAELEVSVERFAEIPIGWDRWERKLVDGVDGSTEGGFEEGACLEGTCLFPFFVTSGYFLTLVTLLVDVLESSTVAHFEDSNHFVDSQRRYSSSKLARFWTPIPIGYR